MKTRIANRGIALIALASLFACHHQDNDQSVGANEARPAGGISAAAMTAAVDKSVYAKAVANTSRSDADRQRDALRKPAEVLQFFGIAPGDRVLDLFSGGGYYTELLSYVVGDKGSVVAHTNAAYASFVGDEATNRYKDNRLPNVEILSAENNELSLRPEDFDAVLMILAYHDIYYVAPDDGWPKIDGPALLAEIYRGMRPGAILGIVDHVAAPGSPRESGNTLHRIDPNIVRAEVEAAGFVFEDSADILRNPEDDHTKSMSDPSIRGKTDRFVMRFRKPG
jgi:predicted methyltransferase